MAKYGRILGITAQLCHNHGIHLAITDVLYKKKKQSIYKEDVEGDNGKEEEEEEEEEEEKQEIDIDDNFYTIQSNSFQNTNIICEIEDYTILDFSEKCGVVVKTLRKTIRNIRTSSVKKKI